MTRGPRTSRSEEWTGFAGAGVLQGEGRGLSAGWEDAVLDAGGEELGDGEALGLDEGASILGDAVELLL